MEAVGDPGGVGEGEGGVADGEVEGKGEGEEAQLEGVVGALESGIALEDYGGA